MHRQCFAPAVGDGDLQLPSGEAEAGEVVRGRIRQAALARRLARPVDGVDQVWVGGGGEPTEYGLGDGSDGGSVAGRSSS